MYALPFVSYSCQCPYLDMHLVYFCLLPFLYLWFGGGKKKSSDGMTRPSCLPVILNGFLKATVVLIKSIDCGSIAMPTLMTKSYALYKPRIILGVWI